MSNTGGEAIVTFRFPENEGSGLWLRISLPRLSPQQREKLAAFCDEHGLVGEITVKLKGIKPAMVQSEGGVMNNETKTHQDVIVKYDGVSIHELHSFLDLVLNEIDNLGPTSITGATARLHITCDKLNEMQRDRLLELAEERFLVVNMEARSSSRVPYK